MYVRQVMYVCACVVCVPSQAVRMHVCAYVRMSVCMYVRKSLPSQVHSNNLSLQKQASHPL